jgi:hypothetical protein
MLRRVALVRTDVSEEISFVLLRSVRRLLVRASVVPTAQFLLTLMMEALRSSETSVLTRARRRNIPKYAILHSHRRENLKSYTIPTVYETRKFITVSTRVLSGDTLSQLNAVHIYIYI